jgi:HSP20 family molecular chaperone IbpA
MKNRSGIGMTQIPDLFEEVYDMFGDMFRVRPSVGTAGTNDWNTGVMTINMPSIHVSAESYRVYNIDDATIVEVKAAGLIKDTITATLSPITMGGKRFVRFTGKYKQLDIKTDPTYSEFCDLELKVEVSTRVKEYGVASYIDGVLRVVFEVLSGDEVVPKGTNIPIT